MKLERKNNFDGKEFVCNLTRELDEVSGIVDNQYYQLFHHYILAEKWCIKEECFAIRILGDIVGGIWFDNNNVITKIVIDKNSVVKVCQLLGNFK